MNVERKQAQAQPPVPQSQPPQASPPKPWMKSKTSKKHMHKLSDDYTQGFVDKCAELNVDPNALLKLSQMGTGATAPAAPVQGMSPPKPSMGKAPANPQKSTISLSGLAAAKQ